VKSVENLFTYVGICEKVQLDKPRLFNGRFNKYATMIGLTKKLAESPNHSDGQLQKWLFILALETCESVLIFDESLNSMHVNDRETIIYEILPAFARENNIIVFLVAHCDSKGKAHDLHKLTLFSDEDGNTCLTKNK
jgi:ABC-type Mn2+/Zn2+ transport system ATPase subunit